MKRRQRKDAQETRQRLLAAAAEVFAEKGFWEATHAEICRKAGANTAAVNYHFTSKENLYIEAWRHAFERSVQAYPPDGGVSADAPAEERLHGKILALMRRMEDPANFEVEIVHREMAAPTGLLAEVMRRAIEPMRLDMRAIVRELLGEGVSEQAVSFCEMSLVGQCFGPIHHLRRSRQPAVHPGPGGPPIDFDVEELADHVTRFTLAGIQGIREEAARAARVGKEAATECKSFETGVIDECFVGDICAQADGVAVSDLCNRDAGRVPVGPDYVQPGRQCLRRGTADLEAACRPSRRTRNCWRPGGRR